jgi:uncharacterized protein (TIGR01777 family)
MITLITGCTGLVGNALVPHLFKKGYSIQCLKRTSNGTKGHFWATEALPETGAGGFDVVIHLAGENVAAARWSESQKEKIMNSRVDGTRELVDYLSQLARRPKIFICASAVGFYGNRGDTLLTENSNAGQGFLAEVCQRWEAEANRLRSLDVRTINLRFGMVLSPEGGALHKMLPPFRAGVGGILGDGKQYVSWISIRDLVEIVRFVIERENISGPVNVVSPIAATNKELTEAVANAVQKRAFMRVPAFAARLAFGQMADDMLLTSTRATPRVLLENGYTFQDQSLRAVIQYCVKGK